MFTVLRRVRSDARGQLLNAKSVEYDPKDGLYIIISNTETTHFAMSTKDGEPYADAYIMNKEGKTVARYML